MKKPVKKPAKKPKHGVYRSIAQILRLSVDDNLATPPQSMIWFDLYGNSYAGVRNTVEARTKLASELISAARWLKGL